MNFDFLADNRAKHDEVLRRERMNAPTSFSTIKHDDFRERELMYIERNKRNDKAYAEGAAKTTAIGR